MPSIKYAYNHEEHLFHGQGNFFNIFLRTFFCNLSTRNFIKQLLFPSLMITARTQIKEIMRESGLGIENISGDFMDRLDARVKLLVLDALQRAKENGRRTVMGKDV